MHPPKCSAIASRSRRATALSAFRGLVTATPISSVTARRIAAAAIALLTVLSHAQAQEAVRAPRTDGWADHDLVADLEGCPALPACLAILESRFPLRNTGQQSGVGKEIAHNLRRFGEPAKHELLRRASGAHPGWRNLAGDILSKWGGWSPTDVPAIRAALQAQRGGWMARPLAEIKTPEAIQALVEDLALLGNAANQTGWALVNIGPKVLPYLLPILADDQQSHAAASIVNRMGREALVAAPDWISLAASMDNPKDVRLAALRGLAAMGRGAREGGKDLRAMLASPEADLRAQAFKTLVALRDPSVVAAVADDCHPSGAAFFPIPLQSLCVVTVAAFGEHAQPVGLQ
jgi:hypothetical protein